MNADLRETSDDDVALTRPDTSFPKGEMPDEILFGVHQDPAVLGRLEETSPLEKNFVPGLGERGRKERAKLPIVVVANIRFLEVA